MPEALLNPAESVRVTVGAPVMSKFNPEFALRVQVPRATVRLVAELLSADRTP